MDPIGFNISDNFTGTLRNASDFDRALNGFLPPTTRVDPLPLITKLNEEEARRQIPLSIFLGLVSVCGVIGNCFVLYIYGVLYRASNSRIFITCLAVVDLCTCILAIPIETVTIQNQYQFDQPWVCKISRFTNAAATISSANILFLIALDRYRKICKPLKWQFTNKNAKLMCVGAIAFSMLLSWPSLILYGIKSTDVPLRQDLNGTFTECSLDDEFSNTIYTLAYQFLFLLSFLVEVVVIIILYTFIGRKVRFFAHKHELRRGSSSNIIDDNDTELQRTRREKLREIQPDLSSYDELDDSLGLKRSVTMKSQFKSTDNIVGMDQNPTEETTDREVRSDGLSVSGSVNSRNTLTKTNTINHNSLSHRIHKKRKNLAKNTTYLMFIISIAFIVTFVPYLAIVLLREIMKNFVQRMSDSERTAFRFFLRSYFLNAAVNPIIYSIFDRRFRKAFRKCLNDIRSCVCECKRTS
ncbi:hypothetical protein FSP39_015513 [Pinctada imbricata]|uniref:G-protein coupled receptors family 1 profile domain-containing protein n=1 Tax=Pinctada imbricata TaxID=66713 RepID=A0AA88XVV7_PINIB|nr:hypothetical protein FSP39_015513 [Pinctada imbricata]